LKGVLNMISIKHLALTSALTLICTLCSLAQAQTPRINTVNITAEADKVRITAQGDVSEMRVDVADESGDVVFQSGAITGNQLDWKMTDAQGERVAAGTYLVTVTFRTAAGKLRKRVEQVTVEEVEKVNAPTPAAPQATPTPVPVKTTGTVTANRIPKFVSIGPSQATVTNSIITESATKIGINTTAPVSKLHIVSASTDLPPRLQATGTTSYAAGWDFYHGTTGKGYVGVPGTGTNFGSGELILYGGPGTKTSLWAGENRAVTILTNGKVGIGTANPTGAMLHVISSGTNAVYGEGAVDGVQGFSTSSTNGAGIFGSNTAGGYAGYFNGRVKVDGALTVSSCTGCTMQSDQHLKTNFSAINPRLVLDRLSAIPIRAWNYKSDEPTVRHLGPMAQDFRTAFNLGVDDKHIDMIDANGVTMAAIQGLYQMMQEKDRQIAQLQSQVVQLQRTAKQQRKARR
jgi:hypothetical protein